MRDDICEASLRVAAKAVHWILHEEALQDGGSLDRQRPRDTNWPVKDD